MKTELTPEVLLYAYQVGVFPMADPRDRNAIYWFAPDPRAILPLDAFHVSKNLDRLVRSGRFEVVSDRAFEAVMRACAARASTWISEEIIQVYTALHEQGAAHSVECWRDGRLVGGLYGVSIGGAFFGESMFHHARDASKVALVHLVRQLRRGGYVLLDTQYTTPHLEQFGVVEIRRADYERRLRRALRVPATWWPPDGGPVPVEPKP
jgi:leucyl/phenylalanyl-tRNA--protein transferase